VEVVMAPSVFEVKVRKDVAKLSIIRLAIFR